MKKEKNSVTLSTKAIWLMIVIGIVYILFGIIGCFRTAHLGTATAFLLFLSSFINLSFLKIKTDKYDELAEQNIKEASFRANIIITLTIHISIFFILIVFCYLSFKKIDNQISVTDIFNILFHILFVFLGIKKLLTGVFFIRMERE